MNTFTPEKVYRDAWPGWTDEIGPSLVCLRPGFSRNMPNCADGRAPHDPNEGGRETVRKFRHPVISARLVPPALAVLLVAAVYESRPGLSLPKTTAIGRRLEKICEEPMSHIHRAEQRFQIHPRSKAPNFQLASAMEAWFHGSPFVKLGRLCEVDDGEIVRYFRMTLQLLRQLIEAPAADEHLHRKAQLALTRINRDVVDAEQQLRMG